MWVIGVNDVEIALKMNADWIRYLSTKCIGIIGAGLSGKGVAHLCDRWNLNYELIDEHSGFVRTLNLEKYNCVVISPGFSPHHPWIHQVLNSKIFWLNEIDFAMRFCKNPLITVTGTNGKTSTVELTAQLLRCSGKRVAAVGNNGRVLSEVLANNEVEKSDIFVCEISSYQAWSLKFLCPVCTLWTNIAPDHIYYHESFQNYLKAKQQLLTLTNGKIFCGNSLKEWLQPNDNLIFAPKIESEYEWLKRFPACFSRGQCENFVLVRAFAQDWGISEACVQRTFQHFQQPVHRLYCCGHCGDIEFWNDSKGTNLHAVCSALESLKYKKQVGWILGGRGKGEDLGRFIELFNHYPNVEVIYLIGETGTLLQERSSQFHAQIVAAETIDNVFRHFCENLLNHVLVLSPGFASWDQFTSFEQRGEVFEKNVREFIKIKNA